MAMTLVAGRECGTCTACCVELTIDQPELRKLAGHVCPHCILGQGCTIYPTRPLVCRTWFCAWRQLDWIGDALRPDQSDVLICPTQDDLPAGYDPHLGLEVALLSQAGLDARGLAEMLCHAIRSNIASFLCLPGGPGQGGARMLLNEDLKQPAERGQPAILLRELRKVHLSLLLLGQAYMDQPIVLARGTPSDVGPAPTPRNDPDPDP
ncbi:MAG TPA: hypothetical protein VJK90_01100 [Acetobacteraceae bacterium]|jgi:hypothetical protein|nr:hypothetical protein [Acetobacteraceae bacterium]